ncbi:MAG: 4-(cytidine 5'-diphospho)-2-C-methyl-D-erythritol kinase [Rikenellaceae bacterium]
MIKRANCKINIGLNILRRRDDGYHELETVIYPVVGLYDDVQVEAMASDKGAPRVEFRVEGLEIDCAAEDNLCVRAARLMQSRYGVGSVAITLTKRIPFGAGLAGGSSDATAVVLAMNEMFNIGATTQELIDIAAELGSDTAFFVCNTPQLCRGRGEIMSPIEVDLAGAWLVLVKPHNISVSTREAYSGISPDNSQPPLEELLAQPIEQWQTTMRNGFEPHIFRTYPPLLQIKELLLSSGASYAAMSGSGSTIYALFRDMSSEKMQQIFTQITNDDLLSQHPNDHYLLQL